MDLTKINHFYETWEEQAAKEGTCQYVYKRGPYCGSKCSKPHNGLFCDEHQEFAVQREEVMFFLKQLTETPAVLVSILQEAKTLQVYEDACREGTENEIEEYIHDDNREDVVDKLTSLVLFLRIKKDDTFQVQKIPLTSSGMGKQCLVDGPSVFQIGNQ